MNPGKWYLHRFAAGHDAGIWADVIAECGRVCEMWGDWEPSGFLQCVEYGAYELLGAQGGAGALRRTFWALGVLERRTGGNTAIIAAVCRYWLQFT